MHKSGGAEKTSRENTTQEKECRLNQLVSMYHRPYYEVEKDVLRKRE